MRRIRDGVRNLLGPALRILLFFQTFYWTPKTRSNFIRSYGVIRGGVLKTAATIPCPTGSSARKSDVFCGARGCDAVNLFREYSYRENGSKVVPAAKPSQAKCSTNLSCWHSQCEMGKKNVGIQKHA